MRYIDKDQWVIRPDKVRSEMGKRMAERQKASARIAVVKLRARAAVKHCFRCGEAVPACRCAMPRVAEVADGRSTD